MDGKERTDTITITAAFFERVVESAEKRGAAADRIRLRRELGAWLDGFGGPVSQDDLRRELDRIIPEER